MTPESQKPDQENNRLGNFRRTVVDKSVRRVKARKAKEQSEPVWFGLGMFGLVGWSVAIPTLIGILIGTWIDATYPSQYSWTLMMLFVGVIAGCLNAWYWIKREHER